IPIIFLSAVSDFDSKIKGLERGAVDYIIKPYDDREVIARIEVHLKIKALEQERLKHINELEKLNTEKDNLLQVMAHDIRSPLTSIMIMSEFLMSSNTTLDSEKVLKYSNTIFHSSQKILQLINQLMQSIKTEVAKIELTKFDLVRSINHSIDLLARSLEKKSIHLEVKYFSESIPVLLDESKVDQILNNILYNAVKFTNTNGKISLIVEKEIKEGKEYLHISIADNGVGIPKSILNELMTKKFSSHRAGTLGEEGTGLGLSITKNLIAKLNGKIEIESEENVGTIVHLYFYSY
ncbi:MAG TPA: ATP-binding protein, partial [Leptospiraceae bacterium]|nr:ATP-binding protein [Leptospiraceae bacterium]